MVNEHILFNEPQDLTTALRTVNERLSNIFTQYFKWKCSLTIR